MRDFRSDTVTRPTAEMWEAMHGASLDDDTLEGSRSVAQLEQEAARLAGKEAALYVVSGTMANLLACLTHATRGGEMVADAQAHVVKSEAGGFARLCGLVCSALPSVRGEMELGAVEAAIRPGYSRYGQRTALVVMETSHNHSGGYVPSLSYMSAVKRLTERAETAVHVDGARIFNAAAALGIEVGDIAAHSDTLTFCLSKGLSAPMGALLLGPHDFIERARTFRRMVGGGLRQAGPMAAAGLVALTRMRHRLAEDNARGEALWRGLRAIDSSLVDEKPSGTNIVAMRVAGKAKWWEQRLEVEGIAARSSGSGAVRFVTHHHVDDEDVRMAVAAVRRLWENEPEPRAVNGRMRGAL